MQIPFSARSRASISEAFSPYVEQRREPIGTEREPARRAPHVRGESARTRVGTRTPTQGGRDGAHEERDGEDEGTERPGEHARDAREDGAGVCVHRSRIRGSAQV